MSEPFKTAGLMKELMAKYYARGEECRREGIPVVDDCQQRLATQIAYHRKKWISSALREFLLLVGQHAAEWRQNYVG